MTNMTYYTVFLDGIDKCGKDTIAKYVWQLDKRLNVLCRGYPSLVVYAKKFNRDCVYSDPDRNILFVHIDVDFEDWKIRCVVTNEAQINYADDSNAFTDVFNYLHERNYQILRFNSSLMTPYSIAKAIVNKIKELNKEN